MRLPRRKPVRLGPDGDVTTPALWVAPFPDQAQLVDRDHPAPLSVAAGGRSNGVIPRQPAPDLHPPSLDSSLIWMLPAA